VPYFLELEKVHLLCTVWNYVGTCSMKTCIISISSQDCNNSVVRTSYIIHTIEGKYGSYRIL
jgi:hypothetical protein